MYNKKYPNIAGWSSWQLVGLITRRSIVRVYPPQPRNANCLLVLAGNFFWHFLGKKLEIFGLFPNFSPIFWCIYYKSIREKILYNIFSNTLTTMLFPACLYNWVLDIPIDFALWKSISSNPIRRKHSRGVNFLILKQYLLSSEINTVELEVVLPQLAVCVLR